MIDASGLTSLELAKQFTSLSSDELEQERQSVRRWDVMAGGTSADWGTCLRLLEGAATSIIPADSEDVLLTGERFTQQSKPSAKLLPALAELDNVATNYCDDGDECQNGKCRTAIWENAFRMTLASSMKMSLNNTICPVAPMNKAKGNVDDDVLPSPPIETEIPSSSVVDSTTRKSPNPSPTQKAPIMGRQCDSCGKHSPALFRSVNHQLVCRSCRRLGRRVNY
mmetsp:Transcript_24309/g.44687  ORF Transcript_24309/g.44687 Transcript_24309/m.44687 type:complete len:224 (+) Transcript_24309:1-672(+)